MTKPMQMLIIVLFAIIGKSIAAQSQYELVISEFVETLGISKLIFIDSQEDAKKIAQDNIGSKQIFLILHSGIAPKIYATDKKFEKLFTAKYYEFGCVGPESEFVEAYNSVIFHYLDRKFGKVWRKKIRKDVVGFKKWKKKNRKTSTNTSYHDYSG